MTEEGLLNSLKKHRPGSLERAIEIYTPYVSVIVYNIIGAAMTKEDVEEAVSDVFIALWRSAHRLDGKKGTLRSYLGAAARSCAVKKLRELRPHDCLDDNTADMCRGTAREIEEREEYETLISLIKTLGEPDSEIFLRHYWYGESTAQIAAVTGVNRSTITTKLQRGRSKLKAIIEKEVRR